jgi:hypothetical protein
MIRIYADFVFLPEKFYGFFYKKQLFGVASSLCSVAFVVNLFGVLCFGFKVEVIVLLLYCFIVKWLYGCRQAEAEAKAEAKECRALHGFFLLFRVSGFRVSRRDRNEISRCGRCVFFAAPRCVNPFEYLFHATTTSTFVQRFVFGVVFRVFGFKV